MSASDKIDVLILCFRFYIIIQEILGITILYFLYDNFLCIEHPMIIDSYYEY